MIKLVQITSTNDQELVKLIDDQRAELAKLLIDGRTKKMSNVKQIKTTKRVIAQALTIQRERQLAVLEQAAEGGSDG